MKCGTEIGNGPRISVMCFFWFLNRGVASPVPFMFWRNWQILLTESTLSRLGSYFLAESKFDSTSFFNGDSLIIYRSQIDWLTQCPVSTSVSVYLANLICVCFPGQPNCQFHFMCVPFYMRLHYVTCLRSNWRITYGKISPERIIHCLSVINVLFSTFW